MGPNSDLDVLVIMPDGTHRRRTAQEVYRRMWGFGFAKDIVVVTESDVREYGTNLHDSQERFAGGQRTVPCHRLNPFQGVYRTG